MALQDNPHNNKSDIHRKSNGTYSDPLQLGGCDELAGDCSHSLLVLLLRRQGSGPLRGLHLNSPRLDGRDLPGRRYLLCRLLVVVRVLYLDVLERGKGPVAGLLLPPLLLLLLAVSATFHRARRDEVTLAKSLEPPSVEDSSTFLLALLSDAFLHQHKIEALNTAPTRETQAETTPRFKRLTHCFDAA